MVIPEYFAGERVFITGGTGFIGKVLVEKMLRCCPDVDRIYVAMRAKKGRSAQDRWDELTKLPLFDIVRNTHPEYFSKVRILNADMKDPDLGISEEDKREIINNVTIVYHIAATVQFADNIIDTLIQNTRATYLMVELVKKIVNLKVFVYVSTCYTNFFRPESQWDEKLYPAVQDWRVILKLIETQPNDLAMIKEKLLCGHPNPYTFSKSLAEQIVADNTQHFKAVVIVRPSVVMPAVEDPLPGWVDSLNGMAALCITNSFGVLRVARHSDDAHQDYIPVDIVAKALFLAPAATARKPKEEYPLIYNVTLGKLRTIRTSEISEATSQATFIQEIPSKYIIWSRDLKLIRNPILYHVLFTLEQVLPACFLDLAFYLSGNQPFFLKLVKKLAFANQILFKDFQFSRVHFHNEKFLSLIMKEVEPEDKAAFAERRLEYIDDIPLREVLKDTYIGVLKYFFKEDLSEKAIARNKKRYNRIMLLEKTVRILFYSVLGYLAYLYFPFDRVASFFESISIRLDEV